MISPGSFFVPPTFPQPTEEMPTTSAPAKDTYSTLPIVFENLGFTTGGNNAHRPEEYG